MRPSQLSSIREFMARDHREDVDRLNGLLHSSGDAGLAREVPPIPFTGDIDSVEKGNCICLIGINPLWSAKQVKHVQEYRPAERMISRFRAGDERAYGEYIESRLRYFDYEYANWGHFDKSGYGYPELAFPDEDMRSVWKKHAYAMDIVPYFSRDAGRLDKKKIVKHAKTDDSGRLVSPSQPDPALENHQRIIREVITETRPKIIHLNGSHGMYAFEKILQPKLELQEEFSQYKLKFGHVVIEGFRTKVIAHNQFARGAWTPNPPEKYWPQFIEEWREWCKSL